MKYEYAIVHLKKICKDSDEELTALTDMGNRNLELVSVDNNVAYLKRPIESKPKTDSHRLPEYATA